MRNDDTTDSSTTAPDTRTMGIVHSALRRDLARAGVVLTDDEPPTAAGGPLPAPAARGGGGDAAGGIQHHRQRTGTPATRSTTARTCPSVSSPTPGCGPSTGRTRQPRADEPGRAPPRAVRHHHGLRPAPPPQDRTPVGRHPGSRCRCPDQGHGRDLGVSRVQRTGTVQADVRATPAQVWMVLTDVPRVGERDATEWTFTLEPTERLPHHPVRRDHQPAASGRVGDLQGPAPARGPIQRVARGPGTARHGSGSAAREALTRGGGVERVCVRGTGGGIRHDLRLPQRRAMARAVDTVEHRVGAAAAGVIERGADVLRKAMVGRAAPRVCASGGSRLGGSRAGPGLRAGMGAGEARLEEPRHAGPDPDRGVSASPGCTQPETAAESTEERSDALPEELGVRLVVVGERRVGEEVSVPGVLGVHLQGRAGAAHAVDHRVEPFVVAERVIGGVVDLGSRLGGPGVGADDRQGKRPGARGLPC